MIENLKATEGRLIVKVIPDETKSSGGILLAKPSNPDVHKGIVLSAGEPLDDSNQKFEVGNEVYWQSYSGVDMEENGENYLIINQKDIIAYK